MVSPRKPLPICSGECSARCPTSRPAARCCNISAPTRLPTNGSSAPSGRVDIVLRRSLSQRWRDAKQDLRRRLAMHFVSDRNYLARLYHAKLGTWPNLEAPRGFNEKILFKMLHDRRAMLTLFSDKLRVRDYVRKAAPALSFPTLYWWSSRAETLPFDALPGAFVLKANHGSGWNCLVHDKSALLRTDLVRLGKRWLNSDF